MLAGALPSHSPRLNQVLVSTVETESSQGVRWPVLTKATSPPGSDWKDHPRMFFLQLALNYVWPCSGSSTEQMRPVEGSASQYKGW